MASPQSAAAKWGRKMGDPATAAKWKANSSSGDYAGGMTRFWGSPPKASIVSNWRAGVDATSPSDFQSSTQGKENKWLENARRGAVG